MKRLFFSIILLLESLCACGAWRHKWLSVNKGLVVNQGQWRRSPVQPDSQLHSALPCQTTPQPAGGNLQLQHLSRINSSTPTREPAGAPGRGAAARWYPGTRLGSCQEGRRSCFINSQQCRCWAFSCLNWRSVVNNGARVEQTDGAVDVEYLLTVFKKIMVTWYIPVDVTDVTSHLVYKCNKCEIIRFYHLKMFSCVSVRELN